MTRPDLRSERGFTMIAVMIVMMVATAVASATLLATQNDLPFSKASSDRKQAYAAAEAGIEYYLHQLANDNDFWTKCANVPALAPIVQKETRPREWRTLAGTKSAYAIELMPASGATCTEGSAESTMLDQSSGTIKIRSTGKAGKIYRSIVAEFRRDSFLDFLYFTDRETFSPEAYADEDDQETAADPDDGCDKPRNDRTNQDGGNPCAKIRFISDDMNNGPFHTNDDILACGNYKLGRNPADKIEIVGPNRWQHPDSSPDDVCNAGEPDVNGTLVWPATYLPMPTTNLNVKNKADPSPGSVATAPVMRRRISSFGESIRLVRHQTDDFSSRIQTAVAAIKPVTRGLPEISIKRSTPSVFVISAAWREDRWSAQMTAG